MIFSTLSDDELERWTYARPDDAEAKAEMLRRVRGLMEDTDHRVEELTSEVEMLEEENNSLRSEVDAGDEAFAVIEGKLQDALDRVAELTSPEGLV